MLTQTKSEFECLLCDAKELYRRKVGELNKKDNVGRDDGTFDVVEELSLYLDVLDGWSQDKFTYLNNVNVMNDYDVRAIHNRIRQLS